MFSFIRAGISTAGAVMTPKSGADGLGYEIWAAMRRLQIGRSRKEGWRWYCSRWSSTASGTH